jgi:predicted methyltransferase
MRFPNGCRRRLGRLVCVTYLILSVPVAAQDRAARESRRDGWQKVAEIFAVMGVQAGATVADVGAGDGFFTARLARAVGPDGRVFAVDVDDEALDRLRKRLVQEGLRNVTVVKGTPQDPNLPEGTLDAALIVSAYHEMTESQSMLTALRRALKRDGRLVIVEPVRRSRRGRPRADQFRDHEIDPEFVLQDARATGFRVITLQDPFVLREGDALEWLIALQPMDVPTANAAAEHKHEPEAEELNDASLRVPLAEFTQLASAAAITIVDVRDRESFEAAHIPGAVSIPLETIESGVEQLRRLGKPIVTYCS